MWTNHYLKEVVAVDTTGNLWSHVLRLRISRGFILGSALALSAYILGPTLFEFLTTGNPKLERASRDDKYTVGLLNKGNDCFANSSVQALASIPSFTIYLTHVLKVAEELNLLPNIAEFNTNVNYEAQADSSRPTPVNWTRTELLLHFALAEVIHNLQQLTLTPKTASLKLLIQAIERKVHATMSRGQNDAQEFTQLLLQLLDDEYKLFVKMLEKQKPTCKLPEFPFTGLIANSLVCMKCGKSSRITPGEFIMHTISVPHTTRQVDLDNLLFENQTESIEGYYCLTCDVGSVLQHSNLRNMQAITHDEAAKLRNLEALLPALHINDSLPDDLEQYLERSRQHSFRLSKPTSTILKRAVVTKSPEVLIIHLSRSYFNGMTYAKNQCKVKFQEKLTIYEQVIKNSICAGMRPVVYRLTSIIKHSGTHSQGHYECYRRKPRIKQDLSTQITKDFSPTIPPSFFECLNRNATRTCSETPSSRTDMPSHLSYFPPTAAVSAATHANAFGARLPQEETLGAITSHATTGAGSPESTSDTKQKRRYRTLKTTTSYPWWKLSDTKGFKLKKDSTHYPRNKLTSADISAPTQEGANIDLQLNRLRSLSNSSSNRGVKHSGSMTSTLTEVPVLLKALYTYHAQSPGELSFTKGDVFHIVGEDGEWYEVSSPENGKRGMVPKSYFDQLSKSRVVSSQSILNSPQQVAQPVKAGSLYAIVLYDFKAEKSDELSTFAGENLFICAHHDYEWFIAKPIGRLGGPGLVPVGFVSIIDINSGYATGNDVKDDIESVNLPTVQEWKGNIARYKASNISLGSVELHGRNSSTMGALHSQSVFFPSQNFEHLIVTHAAVDSFLLEGEKYWFHVVCELEDGTAHSLKRYYEDFYDLQVQLLDAYPAEAGKLRNSGGQWTKRIMPYIPGPVPYVTDSITKKRKDDLNVYVKELIALPPHISQSNLVKSLFAIRNNGFDRELVRNTHTLARLEHDDATVALTKPKLPQQEESTLTSDDLRVFHKMGDLSLNDKSQGSKLNMNAQQNSIKPTKIKFYYKDDIFALLLSPDIPFEELHRKIAPRIDSDKFLIYAKEGDGIGMEINSDEHVSAIIQGKLKITVLDA